jgi:hypothetical protein
LFWIIADKIANGKNCNKNPMSDDVWVNNDCLTTGDLTSEHRALFVMSFTCIIVLPKQIHYKDKKQFQYFKELM